MRIFHKVRGTNTPTSDGSPLTVDPWTSAKGRRWERDLRSRRRRGQETLAEREFLPRQAPHAWDVYGGGLAKVLIMTVPAMLEEYLREFHAPTIDSREQIAAKYGIRFLHKSDH